MKTSRVEAFSDGVLAIIITIMVLELRVPDGAELSSLRGLCPVLLSYVLSFVYLGIYWNNHHHMFAVTSHVTVGFCGPICTFCSGSRLCHLSLDGWGRTSLPGHRPPSTA
jgi:uncharacterized membrane protein